MRIKWIVSVLAQASLACTANVSVLSPTATPSVALVPAIVFVDAQNGWAIASDAGGHTSLYKITDGGQTWTAQIK